MENVTLRQAQKEDLPFLFNVSTLAMQPVVEALKSESKTLDEYTKTFEPKNIQVIQYNGIDVGRLRVVQTKESIYIGGIQILPEYQRQGIGKSVLQKLIEESDKLGAPIILEVHDVNRSAKLFYQKFGFALVKTIAGKSTLQYLPVLV